MNNSIENNMPEYLVVYEHRHGNSIFRVKSGSLSAHLGWNSFDERHDDPIILALCKALGITFELDEHINIFDMPESKRVFNFEELQDE